MMKYNEGLQNDTDDLCESFMPTCLMLMWALIVCSLWDVLLYEQQQQYTAINFLTVSMKLVQKYIIFSKCLHFVHKNWYPTI